MALRGEVVDLVRLQIVEQLHQVYGIAQVAVMQEHLHAVDVRVGVKMIDPRGVEGTRPANDAVHFVTFGEQQIGKITAVLPSDSGDQCSSADD